MIVALQRRCPHGCTNAAIQPQITASSYWNMKQSRDAGNLLDATN